MGNATTRFMQTGVNLLSFNTFLLVFFFSSDFIAILFFVQVYTIRGTSGRSVSPVVVMGAFVPLRLLEIERSDRIAPLYAPPILIGLVKRSFPD